MQRRDVRLSVCPSTGPQQQTRYCRFGPGGQEISIDCCTIDRRSAAAARECGQCRVVSVRGKLAEPGVVAGCVAEGRRRLQRSGAERV